jgi:hypothetical protein
MATEILDRLDQMDQDYRVMNNKTADDVAQVVRYVAAVLKREFKCRPNLEG